jgi:hypothetical protein
MNDFAAMERSWRSWVNDESYRGEWRMANGEWRMPDRESRMAIGGHGGE